jgi:surface protein
MSVRYASQSNTTSKTAPNPPQSVPPAAPAAYTRPADWTALPSLSTSDTKFTGLVAVTNDSTNYITFSATGTSLAYDIDWGDGTTQTGVGTGTVLQKTYNYATLSSSVASAGYKMAIVTVTVTGGTFSTFSLINAPTNIGSSTAYTLKWLDIAFAGSNLTSYSISGTTSAAQVPMLQQINIVSANAFYPQWLGNSNLSGATGVQNIIIGTITTPITSFNLAFANTRLRTGVDLTSVNLSSTIICSGMYQNCNELQVVPDFPSTTKPTTITNMFNACSSLRSVPKMDLSSCTTANSAFLNCSSLVNAPNFYMPACTTIASMFSGCSSLVTGPVIQAGLTGTGAGSIFLSCSAMTSAPGYNLGTVTDCNNMFSGCSSLVSVGVITASSITSCTSMFTNCNALKYIAGLNLGSSLTTINSMFQSCTVVDNIPSFNTSNVTVFTSAFINCSELSSVPAGFDTTKGLNLSTAFQNCSNLQSIPSLNTANTTNLVSTFAGCSSLTTIPSLNTSNVTTFQGTFTGCTNLSSVPTFDMTKNITLNTTFQNCFSLNSIPAFNTSNVTVLTGAFQATSITTAPSIDTSKVTTMLGVFANCSSLNTIPNYNLSNVTASITNGLTALPSLSNIQMTGTKITHSIASDHLGQTELQNYFANLGSNTTTQTITITSNPGVDTANSKTSGTTAGSNVITMANTVGIIAGSTFIYGTGVNTGIPVTFTDAGDTVVYTNGGGVNGLANGDNVMFTAITSTTGIVINTPYFVVNRTGTTFQVSATSGGAALPLTTNGTGTMSIGGATISNKVLTVNANANVIINGVSGITNASASLTARNLNTNYAVIKNWTVTG